jgi:NAD+ kinase
MLFKTVGLLGKTAHSGASLSIKALLTYLADKGCRILVENSVANELGSGEFEPANLDRIGQEADLAICIGGDGKMLGAARVLSAYDIFVVGINRGNLGFLTDLNPDDALEQLNALFNGEGKVEKRFLLEAEIVKDGLSHSKNKAVNEIVLHHSKVAHMMEFQVYVDDQPVFSQRADGLIVATPTGSTAYSLSGGGPILTPNLDAITLVPMFPHSLSVRPIVIDANSEIRIKVSPKNEDCWQVSCDSHVVLTVSPQDDIFIRKSPHQLQLIHPKDYSYFNVLRNKLQWGSKLF